ncbi:endodeoxyribonuclease [Apiotrichum porosum]|uniref:Endodeoxyribonuclease n=1 Tax=Apiotrichum porosum TaxID=105984 RepID=A0A427XLK0_9TREE|nr:endodeoxyribonuclease [Apiotrichum porosum]RSH79652.1 endodeoxyribonuclease [Apiotrichum porosum]
MCSPPLTVATTASTTTSVIDLKHPPHLPGNLSVIASQLLALFIGKTFATPQYVVDLIHLCSDLQTFPSDIWYILRKYISKDPVTTDIFVAYRDHAAGFEGEVDYILVAEKDAVLRRLVSSGILADPDLGQGAIITGRGQPDHTTKELFCRLALDFPSAAVLGLFDADPWGLTILTVCKHGSRKSRQGPVLLWCPRLRWIGIKHSECLHQRISPELFAPLSPTGIAIVQNMLLNPDTDVELLPELALMRVMGGACIEAAYSTGDDRRFIDYVRGKIREARNL